MMILKHVSLTSFALMQQTSSEVSATDKSYFCTRKPLVPIATSNENYSSGDLSHIPNWIRQTLPSEQLYWNHRLLFYSWGKKKKKQESILS